MSDQFLNRHNGPSAQDVQAMLNKINAPTLDALIDQTVPAAIHLKKPLNLPDGMSEHAFLNHLRGIAAKNKLYKSYIGLGYYDTLVPPVIQRNVLENPGWYTAYTPYQAGDRAGPAGSAAEFPDHDHGSDRHGDRQCFPAGRSDCCRRSDAHAARSAFARRCSREKNSFFVSNECFPQTIELLKTRAKPLGHRTGDRRFQERHVERQAVSARCCNTRPPTAPCMTMPISSHSAKATGMTIAVAADILSLVLLTPPGEWGADVVLGSTQRFGVPMGYGGPHAAYFACRDAHKRSMPGRIIGVSVDADGNPALRMALQTREQHIRREKATSNICTAQALLAIMASMYAVYHGAEGLRGIATQVHLSAVALANELKKLGYAVADGAFFDTVKLLHTDNAKIHALAEAAHINFRYTEDGVGISLDQTTSPKTSMPSSRYSRKLQTSPRRLPPHRASAQAWLVKPRQSAILSHPVFNSHHSETEMMRYIKRLENKDLSLTHSMISLGSCTMKLNAASEMLALTWPEFANLHPFVPVEQAEGFHEVIAGLNAALTEITGFAQMSFQPNSGASGEYAGLLVIQAYHRSRGEAHRKVVLIPSSAHGTNPASAAMAGLDIVVVKCDSKGNIDVDDLRAKAEEHKADLSCLMVTYPSTHGVYEESIRDITAIIHANGGQVYMDGANMNAQVGLTSPGNIGADVCHLNLHKTFAIPHGGGGPGAGPIGVAEHLAPFLPSHPVVKVGGAQGIHAVSAPLTAVR